MASSNCSMASVAVIVALSACARMPSTAASAPSIFRSASISRSRSRRLPAGAVIVPSPHKRSASGAGGPRWWAAGVTPAAALGGHTSSFVFVVQVPRTRRAGGRGARGGGGRRSQGAVAALLGGRAPGSAVPGRPVHGPGGGVPRLGDGVQQCGGVSETQSTEAACAAQAAARHRLPGVAGGRRGRGPAAQTRPGR